MDDWILSAPSVLFAGRPSRWTFTKKGSVYDFEITLEGKKKVLKQNKVLELNCKVASINVFSEKNLLLVVTTAGEVTAYNVDNSLDNVHFGIKQKYSLMMVDRCSAAEFNLDRKNNPNYQLDSDALEPEHKVIVQASRVINETYVAISAESQYIYFRNYMKRIVTVLLFRLSRRSCSTRSPLPCSCARPRRRPRRLWGLAKAALLA